MISRGRISILWLASLPMISAQKIAEPGKVADSIKLLASAPKEQPLQCKVQIVKPILNYAFQFESGYSFQVPLDQYSGPGHTWRILSEVTPQETNASPVYLLDTGLLPELVQAGAIGGASGGYRLGEGRYSVRWLLLDDLGRTCRKNWRIDVDRNGKFIAMEPHTVSELPLSPASMRAYSGSGTPLRITVLLDAAPFQVRRESPARLYRQDRSILLYGLAGLMERLPASPVRLIIFNLEQQEVVLRREEFAISELDSVALALKNLGLGTVPVGVVEKPKGHVDLITSLLNDEIRSPLPSDAVVILGPQERYLDKVPEAGLNTPRGNKPLFFSLQLVSPPNWVRVSRTEDGETVILLGPGYGGTFVPFTTGNFDTISKVIRSLNGKAVQVRTPNEFEKAIEDIELSQRSGAKRIGR